MGVAMSSSHQRRCTYIRRGRPYASSRWCAKNVAKHLCCKICNHSTCHLSYKNAQGEMVNIYARHLPLQGKKLDDGTWATVAAAAATIYPSDLNRALEKAISTATCANGTCAVLSLFGGRGDRSDGLGR
eukprot:5460225-Amphidinium_carterae.1